MLAYHRDFLVVLVVVRGFHFPSPQNSVTLSFVPLLWIDLSNQLKVTLFVYSVFACEFTRSFVRSFIPFNIFVARIVFRISGFDLFWAVWPETWLYYQFLLFLIMLFGWLIRWECFNKVCCTSVIWGSTWRQCVRRILILQYQTSSEQMSLCRLLRGFKCSLSFITFKKIIISPFFSPWKTNPVVLTKISWDQLQWAVHFSRQASR